MSTPLISVIIPIYKTEKYIKRCLKSVTEQTYKNLQIILVDDGSPDNCPRLCEKFAKQDSRITVIHQKNAGVGKARNAGLSACKGDYVSFIDSDDYVHSMFIESLYVTLKKYDADIASCNMIKTSWDKSVILNRPFASKTKVTLLSGIDAALRIADDEGYFQNVSVCNKLFKISLFDHICFSDRKIAEDLDVAYRALFASHKVALVDRNLYYYYMNKNSAMHSHDDVYLCVRDVLDEYDKMCIDKINDRYRLKQILERTFIKRMDFVLEDYFYAFMNHHSQRMRTSHNEYDHLKSAAKRMNISLKLKFLLFEINPMFYLVARWGYGAADLLRGEIKR